MPILNVKVSATKSPQLGARIATTLTELTQRVLGKDPKLTAITLDWVDPGDWFIAGQSLAERGLSSFCLDIKVTDETNTKAEKQAYIEGVFAAFATILGELHEESYVHVHDVRAAAYGYGGKTQEHRHQHPGS